jgi:hypothetical protein
VLASKYFDLDANWCFGIFISPLRVAALPSELRSDLKASTYLRLQVCKKKESKSFVDDQNKNEKLRIIVRCRCKDAMEIFSLLPTALATLMNEKIKLRNKVESLSALRERSLYPGKTPT